MIVTIILLLTVAFGLLLAGLPPHITIATNKFVAAWRKCLYEKQSARAR